MSWYGGAFGGNKVAPITLDVPISSFAYSNQISADTGFNKTITISPSDHANIRHRIRTGNFFRKGASLHPTQGGFELLTRYIASTGKMAFSVRILHDISVATSPYVVTAGKKHSTSADYNTALGTPTRMILTALGTGVSYDTNNTNAIETGGVAESTQAKPSGGTTASMVQFRPYTSGAISNSLTFETAKRTYVDNFIDALSGGVTLRVEVFY